MIARIEKLIPLTALAVVCWYLLYLGRSLFAASARSLLFCALGLVCIAFLWLLRGVLIPRLSVKQAVLSKQWDLPGRISHSLLFLVAVFILKNTDFSWNDFERTGLFLPAHLVSRVILLFYFMAACFGAGKILLEKKFSHNAPENLPDNFILCFFSGASILAIISVTAGFLGVLNLYFALLVMLALVFYTAPFVCRPLRHILAYAKETYRSEPAKFSFLFIFCWFLAGAGLFYLISQGLYPGVQDPDVWEHYLHYYREVINTGHLEPNMIWYHYYLSKGAGLFFLTGALSDVLSAQLVSASFVFVSCLILYQLCRSVMRDVWPALTAVIVFLCLYNGCPLKHHVVMTGYIAFFIWVIVKTLAQETRHRIYTFCGAIGAFYFGFYQPLVSVLLLIFYGFLTAGFYLFEKTRAHSISPAWLFVSGFLGIFLVLAVNFMMTGIAYDSPPRLFWQFADKSRFLKVIGPSGISFFLCHLSGGFPIKNFFDYYWIQHLLRLDVLKDVFPFWLIASGLCIAWYNGIKGFMTLKPVLISFVFISVAVLFSLPMKVLSFYRLYAFMLFFVCFFVPIILNAMVSALPDFMRKKILLHIMLLVSAAACCGLIQKMPPARLNMIVGYFLGKVSFAEALNESDSSSPYRRSIGISEIAKLRYKSGLDKKIYSLGYNPGAGYFYPGSGVATEPCYTLGPDAEEIVFGPAEGTKKKLQAMGYDYFFMNPENCFFTGVALSPLFDCENLSRYFRVVAREGKNYLLTWRENGQAENIPRDLIESVDLRRSDAIRYPFSEKFKADLTPQIKSYFEMKGISQKGEGLETAVKLVLFENMVKQVKLQENKILMAQFIILVIERMKRSMPELLNQAKIQQGLTKLEWDETLTDIMITYVRWHEIGFYKQKYEEKFVDITFGHINYFLETYETREIFRQRLGLDKKPLEIMAEKILSPKAIGPAE